MKIAFVTSCAAPGKDGVGDYTRLLAESCQQQGHPARVFALHDRHLTVASEETVRPVPTLRLSPVLPWHERIDQTQARLREFGPDWISVQFVPYGFHRKGLSMRLPRRLGGLGPAAARHLMLHELWIGAERTAPLKRRLVGTLQRWLLLELIRRLAPRSIHTSNQTYRTLLQRHRISSAALPMFGALPALEADHRRFLASLRLTGLSINGATRGEYWIFGMFGTLHPIWPCEPLFSHLARASKRQRKKILIAGIGRLGAGQQLWDELSKRYQPGFDFCHLGEQPPEAVSTFLGGVDFGIATTPRSLIGKSATAAAMLEHGLPVIVNRDDVTFEGSLADESENSSLICMDDSLPERLAQARRRPPQSRLPSVTRQFLRTLEETPA